MAATQTPIKAKQIVDRIAPRAPSISADGTLVAFEAAPWGYKGKSDSRAIWVSRNGEPARKFTAGTAVDSNPVWSPDGTKLAFLSNRTDEKKSQIFLIGVDGGEATPLGDLSGELSTLKRSPDGSELSVLRRQPETKKRKQRNKKQDDAVVVDGEPRYNRLVIVEAEKARRARSTRGRGKSGTMPGRWTDRSLPLPPPMRPAKTPRCGTGTYGWSARMERNRAI